MKYIDAVEKMKVFKDEIEQMKKLAGPDDTMPAHVFFMLMDNLIPAFDSIIEKNAELAKGEEDEQGS